MTGTERLDKGYFVLCREISSMRFGQLTIFFYLLSHVGEDPPHV